MTPSLALEPSKGSYLLLGSHPSCGFLASLSCRSTWEGCLYCRALGSPHRTCLCQPLGTPIQSRQASTARDAGGHLVPTHFSPHLVCACFSPHLPRLLPAMLGSTLPEIAQKYSQGTWHVCVCVGGNLPPTNSSVSICLLGSLPQLNSHLVSTQVTPNELNQAEKLGNWQFHFLGGMPTHHFNLKKVT